MLEVVDNPIDESCTVVQLPAVPVPMLSNTVVLPDTLAATPTVPLNASPVASYGSTAALLKRHAQKQTQGEAAPTRAPKLPKSADDLPLALLVIALRAVPADTGLQEAQQAGNFRAACQRVKAVVTKWARAIRGEAKAEGRDLTARERQGIGFWECEAKQALAAMRIYERYGHDKDAAIAELEDAELCQYAEALRTGCYDALGL